MDLSPETLITSLVVSSAGMSVFLYGKKQVRIPQIVVGLALMVEPYFTEGAGSTLGIAGVLLGGLAVALRSGL